MISSFILLTLIFDSGLIWWGEIRCKSLLGVKGLNRQNLLRVTMGAGGTKPPEARRTSLLNSRYWQALTNSFLPDVLVCSITEYLYEFRRIWRVRKASQNTNELKCSVILHTQTSYKLFIIQLLFSLRIFFRSHFSYYFSSVHSCEDRLHFIYSPQCRYMIFTHFQSSFCSFLIRREKQSR